MAKYLDYLLTFHHFFNIAIHGTDILLLLYEIFSAQSRYFTGDKHHQCHHDQTDCCQRDTQYQHASQRTHYGNKTGKYLRYTLADHLTQSINIIRVDGHDIPVGMGIKILDRQLLHVFKQIITETLQGSLRYRDHDTVVSIRSRYTHQVKACHTDNFPEQIAKVRSLLSDHGQDVVIDQPLHEQSTLNACHNAQYDTDQHKNEVNGIVFENICHQSFKYFSRILNTFTTLHSSAGSTHSAAHRSWHYDSPPFSSKSPPPVWVWASYTSL